MKKLKDSLKSARASVDPKAEAGILNDIGELLYRTSDFLDAQESYDEAARLARQSHDAKTEAAALSGAGSCDLAQSKNQSGLGLFLRALIVARSARDEREEARALSGSGWAESNLGRNQVAATRLARALMLSRAVKDQGLEATILLRSGMVDSVLGRKVEALDNFTNALTLERNAGDRFIEAAALNDIGVVREDLGEKQKALDLYEEALAMRREIGDIDGVAWTTNNIGNIYKTLRTRQEALTLYEQALATFIAVHDQGGEAAVRNNIGAAFRQAGEQQKALESYQQALPLYRGMGDRVGEAILLTNIGNVYYALGDKRGALEYYKRALPVRQAAGNLAGEATTLNNIGAVYVELGQYKTADAYLDRALAIRRKVGDRAGLAATLTNMGNVAFNLDRKHKALADYTEALGLDQAIGDSGGEAQVLNNLGFVYGSLGEQKKAEEYLNRALPLATAVQDPIEEARVYCNLMLRQESSQPALAIFHGKQAINLLQRVRSDIQGLDRALQKSFLASKQDCYRKLAELLIAQGRLPEAQQVLNFLKRQEYADFMRGENANGTTSLELTPAEQQAEDEYQKSMRQIIALGEQWAELRKATLRTADQQKQYEELSDQLNTASNGLTAYYARLYVLLGRNSGANRQLADVKGDVSALKQAIQKLPHTVALYTLVGTDRINVLVMTPTVTVARIYMIAQSDLNKRVVSLQRALRDPLENPKPIAQAMYDMLIRPVKEDLEQAHAETLVWSLDGVLRYVPIAALYDGKQYVVEKYNTVTITPASMPSLTEKPDVSNLNAAAMGITAKYEEALPALPAVRRELYDVVTDAQVEDTKGVLPGTILLDGQFTERALEEQLGTAHSVLHIASHFVFRPGDATQSYLLLAANDGTAFHLTVADFRDNQRLALDDITLMTLSACETGLSGNASNGREVDGLGTTAQLKGAKAVLSSLWEVNDESTGELMSDFYKRWAEGGGRVTKVEALRNAQLDLLMGRVKPGHTTGTRHIATVNGVPPNYSHPHFWAPFILMGNWR